MIQIISLKKVSVKEKVSVEWKELEILLTQVFWICVLIVT